MIDPRIRLLADKISVGVSHERLRRIGEPLPLKPVAFDQLPGGDQQTWLDVATVVASLAPGALDAVVEELL